MTTDTSAGPAVPSPPPKAQPALDEIGRKLIQSLRADGRTRLATLGAQVGLSGDAVRERLRHMTEQGVLQVTCSVDPAVLGFHTLALIGVSTSGPAEPIAEELVEVPEIDLVGCVAGRFDVLAEAVCRDEVHLLQVVDEHVRSRPDVLGATVFEYLDVLKFAPGGYNPPARPPDAPEVRLTAQDLQIIEALREDGRASFQEIADRTGLPYQVARRRTSSLLRSGVIRVETVVNRLSEGTAVEAFVGLKTTGPLSEVTPPILALDEVEIAVVTAGPFDLVLEVACRDRSHLAHLVGEEIRSIPGVVSTETTLYHRLLKLPQSWMGLVRPRVTTSFES